MGGRYVFVTMRKRKKIIEKLFSSSCFNWVCIFGCEICSK